MLRSKLEKDPGVCEREEEEKLLREGIPDTPSRCSFCGRVEDLYTELFDVLKK